MRNLVELLTFKANSLLYSWILSLHVRIQNNIMSLVSNDGTERKLGQSVHAWAPYHTWLQWAGSVDVEELLVLVGYGNQVSLHLSHPVFLESHLAVGPSNPSHLPPHLGFELEMKNSDHVNDFSFASSVWFLEQELTKQRDVCDGRLQRTWDL